MNTIHKFPVARIGQIFEIETSPDAVPLTTQFQDGQMVFWMQVETNAPVVRMRFIAVGTGHSLYPGAKYIGTTQDPGVGFVWHLFQL